MAEEKSAEIPRVKLGTQGLEVVSYNPNCWKTWTIFYDIESSVICQKVSKLGLGCMNISGGYTDPVSDDEGISLIKYAFDQGITFFDTADIYGANANEVLIGKVTIFFSPFFLHFN